MIKKLILTLIFGLLISVTAFGESVPVLLYHNVTVQAPRADQQALLHISKDNFAAQMGGLKEAGYHAITLDDYYDYVKNGKSLPDKPFIITFDDGYLSNYQYAYPIIRELGMKATIFVITARMGDYDVEYPHFSWEQAKEMADSGVIAIGSHTHRHKEVPTLAHGDRVYELRISKYLLDTKIGQKNVHLAFPYGSSNDEVIRLAVSSGYKTICLVGDEGANGRDGNVYGLKRLTVTGDMTAVNLIDMMEREKQADGKEEQLQVEPDPIGPVIDLSYNLSPFKANGLFQY